MDLLRFRKHKREREAVEVQLDAVLKRQKEAAIKLDKILEGLKPFDELNTFLKDAKL